jgi:type IV pilus assembly protein PilO
MTNLQQGAGGVSGALLRRFWVGLPIAAGGLLALLLTAFVLLPQWLGLQRDIKRQADLEELRNELALMRAQLNTSETSMEKAQAQQAKLFEIVTGNGDLSTFMAMVDREARLAGVQLDLFEPQLGGGPAPVGPGGKPAPAPPPAAPPAAAAAKPGAAPAQPAAGGVVEIPGLKRQSILVSARGPFPALLDFLRRLEKLNVLVVQSDLRLLMEESKPAQGVAPTQTVVLKVLLSLYGRPTPAAAIPGTPVPGAPAPAGTVPPAAPAAGAPPAPAPPPAAAAPSPPAPQATPAPPTAPAPAPSR